MDRRTLVCTTCHHVGAAVTETRGSILIEIVLWLCFLIPGLIYSLWRLTAGRGKVCAECGGSALVPTNSPVGRRVIANLAPGEVKADQERLAYERDNKFMAAAITVAVALLMAVAIYVYVTTSLQR